MYIDDFLQEKFIITGSLNDKHMIDDIYEEYSNWFYNIVDDYKGDLMCCRDFVVHLKRYPELYFVTKFNTICVGMKLKKDPKYLKN